MSDWFIVLAYAFAVSGTLSGLAILTYEGVQAYRRRRMS